MAQESHDELDELDDYLHVECELPVSGGSENTHVQVNILLHLQGTGQLFQFDFESVIHRPERHSHRSRAL